jgi:hypothetical protein
MTKTIDMARALALDDSGYRYEFSLEKFEIYEAIVRADEREACAKLFESNEGWIPTEMVASTIRARSNT